MPREQQLVSASISRVANKIAWARPVFVDGAAAASDSPLSNGALVAPGKVVEVVAGAGVQGDVEATKLKHKRLVQFHASDWDFLLARAQAIGRVVLTKDVQLAVIAAALSGGPVCSLQFGAKLRELEAAMFARQQYA